MKTLILFILVLFALPILNAQVPVKGRVTELGKNQETKPLPFVNVYWSGTSHGTVTDESGDFTITRHGSMGHSLVFSFVGFAPDTIWVEPGQNEINLVMAAGDQIDEVTVAKRLGGTYISKLKPIKTEFITEAGLQKLPCCNLSESFENSATIDVGYADAVTGAKHIKMLGLAGVYSQMLFENIPYLRGLESAFGLNYVPGPWMESIQISKGAAAVINGYESTTGQINIEYKKPEKGDPLFVNLFANSIGRFEANLTSAIKVNDKWNTMFLVHGSTMNNKIDRNKDGFMDIPLNRQFNVFNRWKYNPEGNFRVQFGFSVMDELREGGELDFDYERDQGTTNAYGINMNSRKYNGFGKIGVLFPDKPYQSIGFQMSATYFEQEGLFGLDRYTGKQNSLYSNLIYQGIIGNTNHMYSMGGSFQYDDYQETLNTDMHTRTEYVPGIFGQYTYTDPEKFNGIAGFRMDYNSVYGLLLTPRLHMRYMIDENTSLRASAGRGYRSANVLSENMGLLASSRIFYFTETLEMEKAWNYGLNLTRDWHLGSEKELIFSVDLYRTDFQNQVIVDRDRDVSGVYVYNLSGKSYSNNFQAEIIVEPVERFDITLAYRFSDVKSTINGELMEVPLTSRYKGLISLSYATPFRKWAVDFTGQLNGQSRLPDTRMNPPQYQLEDYSPQYIILHAQVSRRFKWFEIYAGGENLTDFRQENPILAPEDPFGQNFDASMVWGPLLGRRFYAGIRYTLK
ncbi:TonB-dependent receptor domain-containing protein [Bacteroidota bacterium]